MLLSGADLRDGVDSDFVRHMEPSDAEYDNGEDNGTLYALLSVCSMQWKSWD